MDNEFTGISESTLSRIMEKYNSTTTTKTNTIDVARAVQHSTTVLDVYFKHFDNVVHRMNKIDEKNVLGRNGRTFHQSMYITTMKLVPMPIIITLLLLLVLLLCYRNKSFGKIQVLVIVRCRSMFQWESPRKVLVIMIVLEQDKVVHLLFFVLYPKVVLEMN